MAPRHWLIKSEPSDYSYQQLERDGRAVWTGVRSFEARKHLRAMAAGDLVLYYHTGDERSVVGTGVVAREAFLDPTSPKGEEWAAVEVAPKAAFASPVPLGAMKDAAELDGLLLLTRGRLSVMPVSSEHFARIVQLGKAKGAKPRPVKRGEA